jgi:hypothetical protein
MLKEHFAIPCYSKGERRRSSLSQIFCTTALHKWEMEVYEKMRAAHFFIYLHLEGERRRREQRVQRTTAKNCISSVY